MYDLHMHSSFSFDGNNSVPELCLRAIELGLSGIAITDHIDIVSTPRLFPEFTPDKLAKTSKCSYAAATDMQSKYAGKLEVFRGIELGQPLHNPQLSEYILHTYDYDFVLGSVHNLRSTDDFYFMQYDCSLQARKWLHEYFDEILDMIGWGMFNSLAHLTYPLRYMIGRDKMTIDLSYFNDQTDEIFMHLIKKNIALEINTSGLRQEIGQTLPGEYYLRRYRELGGQYITFGSDAHRLNDLGYGLRQGVELAQRCGFDCLTIFRARKPVLIPFENIAGGLWQAL